VKEKVFGKKDITDIEGDIFYGKKDRKSITS
jgi:hypothetical protein